MTRESRYTTEALHFTVSAAQNSDCTEQSYYSCSYIPEITVTRQVYVIRD